MQTNVLCRSHDFDGSVAEILGTEGQHKRVATLPSEHFHSGLVAVLQQVILGGTETRPLQAALTNHRGR